MKRTMQLIGLLLVLAMMLAACSQGTTSTATQAPAQAPTQAPAQQSSSQTAAPAEPENTNPSSWISDELVEVTVMRDENGSQPLYTDSLKNLFLEDYLNVRFVIESVAAASYADKKQVLIATDDMSDIMKVDSTDIRTYARQELFVNLTKNRDALPNFFAVFDAQPSLAMGNVDGETYGFPIIQRVNELTDIGGQMPVLRVDLLEKYNLETPTTFDELFDVLTVFKENNPDLIPLTNRKGGSTSATQKIMDTMAYPLGSGSGMYYDEDLGGTWVYGPAHENFKEVLRYLNRLYEAGLLDQDYATNTVDLWKEKMSSGKALMYFDNAGFASDFNIALETIDPSYHLQIIPTMTNSLGQTRNFIYDNNWPDQLYIIPESTDKIDVCLKYFNWAYSDEGCDINSFGIEGESFTYDENGKPSLIDSFMDQFVSSPTPYYEMMSKLGVGLNDFTPYVDVASQTQMNYYVKSEEELAEVEMLRELKANDKGLRNPIANPPLDEAQTERYNELLNAVSNICSQEWDKYIMGVEPIDNYDQVIQAARDAGADEMNQIFNDAWAAALGQ